MRMLLSSFTYNAHFKNIFNVDYFFKFLLNLLQYCSWGFFGGATPHGM